MIKKGLFKKAVLTLAVFAGFGASTTVFAGTSFSGEYRQGEILSFGSNLNKKKKPHYASILVYLPICRPFMLIMQQQSSN